MQTLEQIIAQIKPLNQDAMRKAQIKLDGLLKPTGSLGRLEQLAVQLAGIFGEDAVNVEQKKIIVMAADHGVFEEGVAVSPRSVTAIQAQNMVHGVTGVCVLANMPVPRW